MGQMSIVLDVIGMGPIFRYYSINFLLSAVVSVSYMRWNFQVVSTHAMV